MDFEAETAGFVKELHSLGITPAALHEYEKRLEQAARNKQPNSKFGNVSKALAGIKELADMSEPYGDRIRLEYTETNAIITLNTYRLSLEPNTVSVLSAVLEHIDFIEAFVCADDTVCFALEIKNVFDLPGFSSENREDPKD